MPLMYQTVCQVVANKLQSSSKSNLPKTLHICRKTAAAAAKYVVSSQGGNHLISVGGFIVTLKGGWRRKFWNHSSVSELNSNPSFAAFFFFAE